ncbi:MAG: SDR family oxidoreductase [Hyphomicrobium sp.]
MDDNFIVVTGGSGYIAKHIVLRLLKDGYNVRATVRSSERRAELQSAMVRNTLNDRELPRRLSIPDLDLNRDDHWNDVVSGAAALIHTASPFPMAQPKDENELVRPAVDGTLRALRAAKITGVNRVVLTSSILAVLYPKTNHKSKLDEEDWSDVEDPRVSPYAKSKILAEKAAWDFIRSQAPEIKLTVINPGLVLGPPLDSSIGTSLRVIQRILRAKDPMVPKIGFPIVDVRDLARIHVTCLQRKSTSGKRYIAGDEFLWYHQIAEILKSEFPRYGIKTRPAPSFLIRLKSLFDQRLRSITPVLDRRVDVCADRARSEFELNFRPAMESIISSAHFLVDNKLV